MSRIMTTTLRHAGDSLQILSSVFLEKFRWKVISAVINLDIDADAKDAVLRELIKINKEPQTTSKEPAK